MKMSFPSNAAMPWKERDLQKACAAYLMALERLGMLTFSHSPNEAKRSVYSAASLKAQGMRTGEPDLCILIKGGTTIFVELKTMTGVISKAQQLRSALLGALGFKSYVLLGESPQDAVNNLQSMLRENGVPV
ncbi:MAG: hypothetical protein JWO78_190 [Micavibrio sp.]|nr:hypothetical protein [Micavibrio sp.]